MNGFIVDACISYNGIIVDLQHPDVGWRVSGK